VMAAPEEEAALILVPPQALVTDLYHFRDTLPSRDPAHDHTQDHTHDHAQDPTQDPLVAEMERTLKLMEQIHGGGVAWKALVLRARALGVAPEVGGARAELALGHALKLDPALGVAWRQLGEQRWGRTPRRGASSHGP
uniref:Uncharacterized protein n=1 Tax=Serinus canaria TaxID=9135 RepID=A0A8C9U9R2_SERCA